MCDEFCGKFGFESADDEIIDMCKDNALIIPKLFRYMGMGHCQILADVKYNPGKFFLFDAAGSNGYDYDSNIRALNKFTVHDAITLEELKQLLSCQSWDEVEVVHEFTNGVVRNVTTHYPPGQTTFSLL